MKRFVKKFLVEFKGFDGKFSGISVAMSVRNANMSNCSIFVEKHFKTFLMKVIIASFFLYLVIIEKKLLMKIYILSFRND
jgi:hypothetical protein